MQITKTTEDRVERSVVPFKEQVKEFPAKMGKFFTSNKKRAMIIAASVFVIVAAIGINWMLFGQNSTTAANPVSDQTKNEPSKTPVDASGKPEDEEESFFALAVVDRQKARDEAIEVLQTVVDSKEASAEEKSAATAAISRIASYIEAEGNIEMLVKSKGFTQCVAVVSEDAVSVVVGTEQTLMANELAQIKEIVWLQTGIDPSAMRISEKILNASPTES